MIGSGVGTKQQMQEIRQRDEESRSLLQPPRGATDRLLTMHRNLMETRLFASVLRETLPFGRSGAETTASNGAGWRILQKRSTRRGGRIIRPCWLSQRATIRKLRPQGLRHASHLSGVQRNRTAPKPISTQEQPAACRSDDEDTLPNIRLKELEASHLAYRLAQLQERKRQTCTAQLPTHFG